MDALLARLRRLAPTADPDAALLRRFAAGGDDAAFAELLRRHGPLVWATARRRLPDPADAADVFQATFLLLLQKPPRPGRHPSVGPWLHRVAALTARSLRRKNAARATAPPDVPTADPDPSLGWDLDDALLALGERDRAAVVLCHLLGYTRREAAERLGLPEGTLSAVLHRSLRKLRDRLGDPLPAVAGAAVPAGLAAGTAQAAAAVRLAGLAAVAPELVSLTRGVLRMFWLKKLAAGGLVAVTCLGIGVGLAPRPAAVAADPPPKAKPADAPADKKRGELLRRHAAETALLAAKHAAEAEQAERALADAGMGGRLVVKVSDPWTVPGLKEEFPPSLFLDEFDGPTPGVNGSLVAGATVRDPAALRVVLARVRADPAGPKRLALTVGGKVAAEYVVAVAGACVQAGFPAVTYTGPRVERDRMPVRLDKLQPLVVVGQVTGERVYLAKVLPLDPPAAPPQYELSFDFAGQHTRLAVPWTPATTVLDALKLAGGSDDGPNVWVERPTPGGGVQRLTVDLAGIVEQGDTSTNYLLQPSDRVYVRRAKK